MTYGEAIQYLFGLQVFGARLGLETMQHLAAAAGHPEAGLRFIHVAGTNGKGSTCAMLEAIYRESGRRVGLYSSPHLVSFRERLQVNRTLISEADVVRLVGEAKRWIAAINAEEHPTVFEVITVMALRYFAEQRCDVVIWETGLGGRLDATNIVTPLASVITNIQLDHEKWLGETIAAIAAEKAGIIKPGVPALTAAEHPDALAVIRDKAAAERAPLHVVTHADAQALPERLSPALAGAHQRVNAALAVRTAEVLQPVLPVSEDLVATALHHVEWPGRFQIIRRGAQTVVLDGAHNPAGAAVLADTFRQQFPGRTCTLVLAALSDKHWDQLCATLAPLAHRIITCPVASPRTTSADELAGACRQCQPHADVTAASSLAEAWRLADGGELVLIAGSLYLIGEALELLGVSASGSERGLNDYAKAR